jgi:cell division protein FtsQ
LKKNWTHIAKRIGLLLIVPILIGIYIFVNQLNKNNVCKDVRILIENKDEVKFVTEADLKQSILVANNIVINQTKIKDINIKQLEAVTINNPWVKAANIYIDQHDVVNINVVQKSPICRWLNGDLIQSYLDGNCNAIPVNTGYSANVPIVTSTKIGSNLADQKLKFQIVALCKYIQKDTFWNAAITQINIDENNQFELITNLGNHIILFGDTTAIANKLDRLFVFYKDAMPRQGWNTYHTINVKYDGQIVAIKADSLYEANQKIRLAKIISDANFKMDSTKNIVVTPPNKIPVALVSNKKIVANNFKKPLLKLQTETDRSNKAKQNLKALFANDKPKNKPKIKSEPKIISDKTIKNK